MAGQISTVLTTKHPWVKGIQVCWNEGSRPFPRGDNYEIVKIHWQNLKTFSRTAGPIQPTSLDEGNWNFFKETQEIMDFFIS